MESAQTVLEIGPPHFFGSELDLFEDSLKDVQQYLEFGIGGSTLVAVRLGLPSIVAIDSDNKWVEAVRSHNEVAPLLISQRVTVIHANIGPVATWGHPIGCTSVAMWPNYLRSAWDEWARRKSVPDLVFVDGRFRVACCLSVLASCATEIDTGKFPRVLIHDLFDSRPQYNHIFKYFETVKCVGSMHLLKVRRDVKLVGAVTDLLRFQFCPD